jgi:NTP pyrophosphatase (non-canonical NTP hydrolase)
MEKKEMTLKEYQEKAMTTCMDSSKNPLYMLFMIGEEVGELQGKFSKAIRKGNIQFVYDELERVRGNYQDYAEWDELVMKEIGDILWGLAGLCEVMGWSLEDVAQMNLDKLAARKAIGTIDGNGDGIIRDR